MTGAIAASDGGGVGPVTLTGSWSNDSATSPATASVGTGDPTLTFFGGARTISAAGNLFAGTRQYRINSGAWTTGTSVSVTSGQTLGWRVQPGSSGGPATQTITEGVLGSTVGTFTYTASGYP